MAQTNPSSRKPNRSKRPSVSDLTQDQKNLGEILQLLMAQNPRELTSGALNTFRSNLNEIYTRIKDFCLYEEPLALKRIFIITDNKGLRELQKNILYVYEDKLGMASFTLKKIEGQGVVSLADREQYFYKLISESIPLLRNVHNQFQISQAIDTLQLEESKKILKVDKDLMNKTLQKLSNDTAEYKEADFNQYINNLLEVTTRAEVFRHIQPKPFKSIDAFQQHVREAVDKLAIAADTLKLGGELKDMHAFFFPNRYSSRLSLEAALEQFQPLVRDSRS